MRTLLLQEDIKVGLLKIILEKNLKTLKIQVINTGQKTMTGGRIKRLKKILMVRDFC